MMDCVPQEDPRYYECSVLSGYGVDFDSWAVSGQLGYLLLDTSHPGDVTFVCYDTQQPLSYEYVYVVIDGAGYTDVVTCGVYEPPKPDPFDWGWYIWTASCFWDHWWCDYVNDRYWE
jgi:hypothetical protein